MRLAEAPPEARDAPAITFLGDSFTWGFGVPQGAVYTDVLQRELGSRARIINNGVNAFGSGQQLLLLEERVLTTPPQRVVVAFYFNDLFENGDSWSDRRPWFRLVDDELVVEKRPVAKVISSESKAWMRRSRALSLLGFAASRAKHLAGREPEFNPSAAFPLEPAARGDRRRLHRRPRRAG